MAYQESVVTAITDIPALVHAFAASVGWTVTGTTAVPILTRPAGGMSFSLTAAIAGNDHTLTWAESGGSVATSNARIVSPKLNGTATPTVSTPSKVHLFGSLTPEPYLALVVEYGFNSYRHLYLGNLEKLSAFTGGEVISGCQPLASNGSSAYPMSYRSAQYLFAGFRRNVVALANAGGVRAVHVDNPTTWRRFYGSAGFPHITTFDNTAAIGGFGDDINDGYLTRGKSAFAGVQPLVPITLYATLPITGDTLFAPLGRPAGIRMVNMDDLDPASEFTIASDTWKVFPAFAKGVETVGKSATGWAVEESSYYVGYAYPK